MISRFASCRPAPRRTDPHISCTRRCAAPYARVVQHPVFPSPAELDAGKFPRRSPLAVATNLHWESLG